MSASCAVSIDELNHELAQPPLSNEEIFEAALESFKSYKPHEYTNEAEYVYENSDLSKFLARYA